MTDQTPAQDFPSTCPWLVERLRAILAHVCVPGCDEWYPDFPEDLFEVVECGAPTEADPPDGFRCLHGHYFGNAERRLAAYGPEWQREQAERYAETGSGF